MKKKQIKKLWDGYCFFCKESNYALLDSHRIIEGGSYNPMNTVTVCCRCHRLIHKTKEIVIDKKYMSTKGIVLHYWLNGQEFFKNSTN